MILPHHIILSAEDIRYLRPVQFALLTKIHSSYFSAWSASRQISERSLEQIAVSLCIPKSEVLRGFDLRRQDTASTLAAQHKANELLAYINHTRELA